MSENTPAAPALIRVNIESVGGIERSLSKPHVLSYMEKGYRFAFAFVYQDTENSDQEILAVMNPPAAPPEDYISTPQFIQLMKLEKERARRSYIVMALLAIIAGLLLFQIIA